MFDIEDLKNVVNVDLDYTKQYTTVESDYFQILERQAPYRLLAYMANKYNNVTIFDLGTYRGMSSLALASNPTNKVISYDIVDYLRVNKMDNIEYKIGNFYDDPELLNSPLISLDIEPHHGEAETNFINWLIANNYKGTVICDDIKLNDSMQKFWQDIPTQIEKYDITNYGHYLCGTGLLIFN